MSVSMRERIDKYRRRWGCARAMALPILFACSVANAAAAQTDAATPSAVGVWRGTSTCLVQPSACHDEVVVYRITRGNTSDSVSIDARKIVAGKEVEMGVLGCRLDAAANQITCTIPLGVFRFTIRGDTLAGELKTLDGRRFRDIRTSRSKD
jgi:hypothetical protein